MRDSMRNKLHVNDNLSIEMDMRNKEQDNACKQMIIQTDIPLWSYLLSGQKKSTRKLSRVEAFYDLMQRQYTALHDGRERWLKGNVSELSSAWHWSRDTTASFLDKLEQLNVLVSHAVGNSKAFKLQYNINNKNASGASQNPSEPRTQSFPYNST